ncbi:btb/poz domain-containing [Anaeramoeba flamelloides]|uniref:Btb/poz domain-containing n=1 Tax=Anaeramoeba flamelloides TaxID=1746091 RepID=A0AAV7YPS9_9EUKA|nr:btb/poz domain-containing [Anaeramoeba flamelloides]
MTQTIDQVFGEYINNQELADLKFIVGEKKDVLYAHKFVISLISPFWKELFYSQDYEDEETIGVTELTLPDIDTESFQVFLEYAYKRHIDVKDDQIFKLLNVSDKYEIDELKTYCNDLFQKSLDKTNCISYYENGKRRGIEDWTKLAMSYIEEHSNVILENENCFQKLSIETIKVVLGLKKLFAKEIHVFKSLLRWTEYQKETKYKDDEKVTIETLFSEFTDLIKLDLMSFQDLEEVKKSGIYPVQLLLEHAIKLSQTYKLVVKPLTRAGPQLEDLKVLLLGTCRRGNDRLEHLKESIMSGGIENVDIVNIENTTPTIEKMNEYDTVVVRGRNGAAMNNSTALGNNLARYVEGGKGLTVIAINSLINNDSYRLNGRIVDEGFIPLAVGERMQQEQRELGEVHLPEHPIMEGVQTFKAKDYTHVIGTNEINGGTLIASWNNGFPLITEKTQQEGFGTVVCLNFHPISTKITNDCGKAWLQETDGAKIIANSIQYVGMKWFEK